MNLRELAIKTADTVAMAPIYDIEKSVQVVLDALNEVAKVSEVERLKAELEKVKESDFHYQTDNALLEDVIQELKAELESVRKRFKGYTDAHQECHCGASFVIMLKEQTNEQ